MDVGTVAATPPTCSAGGAGRRTSSVDAPETHRLHAAGPTRRAIRLPEPQPLEVVLVDAEPSLVLLPANDGSADAYLVPAYRFTAEDGGTVDLPAVADEALAGPSTTETTVPDTVEPAPVPVPEPQPCEVLEEADGSGTTHTVQTCPTADRGRRPAQGEAPGDRRRLLRRRRRRSALQLGQRRARRPGGGSAPTASPAERDLAVGAAHGGRHLHPRSPRTTATFVGDAGARTKVADPRAARGPAEDTSDRAALRTDGVRAPGTCRR